MIGSTPMVLAVDDLDINLRLLSDFLSPKGFRVITAANGPDALQEVARAAPDTIILDLTMPGMSGIDVCRILKSDPKTRHIPVIMLTGNANRESNLAAIEAGADDFVSKPFDSVLLEARIRSAIRSKDLQDQIIDYRRRLEIEKELLELKVADRTALVQRTRQVTVFGLAKLAESRDTETGDHLERVRCYARDLAQELLDSKGYRSPDLNEDYPRQIFDSSPLHDIGKVGIPDRILLKPGKLSPEEFALMKTHTLIGGDTLRAADIEAGTNSFLTMGRDIAYSHHEKWDGSGYPLGISGEEIPLASRIVAVADVYDALSSKRPYKEPFTHERSMKIIIEGKGSHFDPDMVDAFLRIEDRVHSIRDTFQREPTPSAIQMLNTQLDEIEGRTKPE